jgi:hypothetical protein
MGQSMLLWDTPFTPYLADDYATKADNHSFARHFTTHYKAPALIKHLDELA